ncbi:MAG: ABC transporter permease [Bacteroidota bacterium]
MFKNYLKVAARALARQKGYATINVLGLALGLACCLLIARFVAHEMSYDSFHEKADTLYRVTLGESEVGEAFEVSAHTALALGPALEDAFPEVTASARTLAVIASGMAVIASSDDPSRVFEERGVLYADASLFDLFTYPLVSGEPSQALTEPGTVLLSESSAKKYFGDASPIGQRLNIRGALGGEYRVNGVFADVPATSHLQFDIVAPLADVLERPMYADGDGAWGWNNFFTYVQLQEGTDLEAFSEKATALLMETELGAEYVAANVTPRLAAQPIWDIHLNSEVESSDVNRGSYQTVFFFGIIGFITLLIALVNYVNLATARALDRAGEVGVRKAIGAYRGQLMTQFLAESAVTNAMALVLAAGLAIGLQPIVNRVLGMEISGALWVAPGLWAGFAVIFLIGTLLAGLYPAFVLSSFRPVAALKGQAQGAGSELWLRRGLVVLQFGASIVLVAGVAVVYSQLNHMRGLDSGIDMEQVIQVPGPRIAPRGADGASLYESRAAAEQVFKDELLAMSDVRSVATSYSLPGRGLSYGSEVRLESADPSDIEEAAMTWVSDGFTEVYGLDVIAGNGIEALPESIEDGEREDVVVNESLVRALGLASPSEAIGEPIDMGGDPKRIVGVLRDFSWFSAHEDRENVLLGRMQSGGSFSIKVAGSGLPQTLANIEALYGRLYAGNPFRYAFVDDLFDEQYEADQRFATLFSVFAGLAVFIACLGLFGLAAFSARKRTKEIGVRKVLGASVASVIRLLSVDFLRLVGLAFVLAAPVAYLLLQRWLDGFAARIDLGPGVFLLAGGLVLLIALATVSSQALRAATVDPVRALRSE